MLKATKSAKTNIGEFLEDAAIGSMELMEHLCGRDSLHSCYLGEGKVRELNLAYFKKRRRRAIKTLSMLAIVCLLFGGCKGYQYHKSHQVSRPPVLAEPEK